MMYPNKHQRKGGRRSSRKAFTLLEILLVVGLLALLASFAIPALVGQGERAKQDMASAAILPGGPIAQAIKLFRFNTGVYPEELKYLIEKPSDDEIAEKWTGPYLEDARGLQDPWGREFQYSDKGQHNEGKFDLWSKGSDGVDGNEDDVKNWEDDR
jgi:general secretion pathway protein G